MSESTVKSLHVSLQENSYDIHIGNGVLEHIGDYIASIFNGKRVAVVSDSNVTPLYAGKLYRALTACGYTVKNVSFPAGEKSKNLQTLELLYDALLNPTPFAVTRSDLIIALGGGVTGDMVGFAAATLLRGVPYVQIPTTLLSQVDSSVGGKVAVDLKQGKNLAGVFYQPKMVLIDPSTLDTLSDRVFFDGMGEVIKYGYIADQVLYNIIDHCKNRAELMQQMDEIIYRSVDIKRGIVERDEKDTGERMVLNFGHTFGHGYEKLGNYETYMHGEAVCCGMEHVLRLGEALDITPNGYAKGLRKLLDRFGLPYAPSGVDKEKLYQTLAHDKKGSGDSITVIFVKEMGTAVMKKMPKALLQEIDQKLWEHALQQEIDTAMKRGE